MENIRHNIQWLKQIDTSLLHLSTNILWLPCIICTRDLLLLHHHLLHLLLLHSQTHTLTGCSQENGQHCVMFTATCYLVLLFFFFSHLFLSAQHIRHQQDSKLSHTLFAWDHQRIANPVKPACAANQTLACSVTTVLKCGTDIDFTRRPPISL